MAPGPAICSKSGSRSIMPIPRRILTPDCLSGLRSNRASMCSTSAAAHRGAIDPDCRSARSERQRIIPRYLGCVDRDTTVKNPGRLPRPGCRVGHGRSRPRDRRHLHDQTVLAGSFQLCAVLPRPAPPCPGCDARCAEGRRPLRDLYHQPPHGLVDLAARFSEIPPRSRARCGSGRLC